ncbi:hypothetical protein CPB86DRAFT_106088 [Serendipita vermifera]|nr:hypothetical protein CPB86DRAFT_106088 [Serendipita vermifera]
MFQWLWEIECYRKWRRRQRLTAGETMVYGLAFSDTMIIPISCIKTEFRLPVKESPILPSGIPKPGSTHDQQELYPFIRRIISYASTIRGQELKEKGEEECIQANLVFSQCWGSPGRGIGFVRPQWEFRRVDVIAICYDRSKPEALHDAIYKWYPSVLQFAAGAPICLVGYCYATSLNSKSGVQLQSLQGVSTNEDIRLVSTREGEEAARQIGAETYIEWTEGKDEPSSLMKALMWYGYYYHMSKPISSTEDRSY